MHPKTQESMFNIISHYGNANENHSDSVHFITTRMAKHTHTHTHKGKDVCKGVKKMEFQMLWESLVVLQKAKE